MKKLRSGYTTGSCAAAAAKAAVRLLLSGKSENFVTIPLPDGSRVKFMIAAASAEIRGDIGQAGVIKDAGDDPDVTNGLLILAQARLTDKQHDTDSTEIAIRAGNGVGVVTKPGLAVAVGEPAINPVPRQMIRAAVSEALSEVSAADCYNIEISIIVPEGKRVARNTLNSRLGISGGISILGTTGIVRPISAEAWTATIEASMDVAKAAHIDEIVLSTGRTSEKCVEELLNAREEALIMMGDYLEFSLKQASLHGFRKIHVATMWAKMLKGAMQIPQTHVRHGSLTVGMIIDFMRDNKVEESLLEDFHNANTAREILTRLLEANRTDIVELMCTRALDHYRKIAQLPVSVYLVGGDGNMVMSC